MRRRDDFLSLFDREGVDRRAILLRDPKRIEPRGRVVVARVVFVSKLEGASQGADDVVVCLLLACVSGRDGGEAGVGDLLEDILSNGGAPHRVQNPSVSVDRRERETVHLDQHVAVSEESIKHFSTGPA
ncbi:hypothetical protein [Steroidobacter gossypii]|uniref:hypothetical protein n=1 Tax=Steroidobacter gossypii TaxID=2805490 RepID=UPI001E2FB3FF|nr:hypothetical protein [Steroidobacter gossypii]